MEKIGSPDEWINQNVNEQQRDRKYVMVDQDPKLVGQNVTWEQCQTFRESQLCARSSHPPIPISEWRGVKMFFVHWQWAVYNILFLLWRKNEKSITKETVTRSAAARVRVKGRVDRRAEGLGRRKWQPTSAFLPGEFHSQRSLEGHISRGCKELDTAEWLAHNRGFWGKWKCCMWQYIGRYMSLQVCLNL